ncbi:MAG: NADH-quinone oxidoreductase subunit L [Chloroflexi bacterium]|nr:NADH-quinone oxidoreductase subunit L [Chloroflexota bacterium]
MDFVRLVPGFPLLGVVLVALTGRFLGRRGTALVACGAVGLAFAVALGVTGALLQTPPESREVEVSLFTWAAVSDFQVDVSLLLDPLSAVMILVVSGVGFLIHVYSVGYMAQDPGFRRYFAYLNLFVFSMVILVLAGNFLLLYVGWELVGLCSYLLISFWYERKEAAKAGMKAFVTTRIGDFGFALGIFLIFATFHTLDYAEVFGSASQVLTTGLATAITLLLFLGAVGKSAQIPLYVWLPDAMEGPTPVSALIHAATMVTAGVYMVTRTHVLFELAPISMLVVAVIGAATAFYAATIATAQDDIKRVLAYSTISQLGYMFLAVGVGAYAAGIFHLTTHAFFKALMFLGAGSVMHALAGEQDIQKMGGLRWTMPLTSITFLAGWLAISGIPPFSGFFSKDEILASAFASGQILLWLVGVITAGITAFYMSRQVFLVFFGEPRYSQHTAIHAEHRSVPHESPWIMTIPLAILAVLAALGGFLGPVLEDFLGPVFAASEARQSLPPLNEAALIILSVAAAGLGIFIAWLGYIRRGVDPKLVAARLGLVYRLVRNKYYVDEVYHALLIRPVWQAASVLATAVDQAGIDGVVNALGSIMQSAGRGLRRVQTGFVRSYALIFLVGVLLVLAISTLR